MPRSARSELECFVLGLVWRHGPCSAYAVRAHLQASPSTQWSGSAGAIYPLVRRLERAGLLTSRAESTGKRRSRSYTVTPRGLRVLRAWIGPPLPAEAVSVAYDPLRSRMRFLGALPPREQRAWVRQARQELEAVMERVRNWHEVYTAGGDPFAALVTRNGELDVQTRSAWLREAERRLARSRRP
jgi:DNA-binding PadR family transcriptional regulator